MPYAVARLLNADEESQQDYNLVPHSTIDTQLVETYREAYQDISTFLRTNLHALVRDDLHFHRTVLADLAEGYEKDDDYPIRRALAFSRMALASVLNFSVGIGLYQEHSEIRAGRNGGQKSRARVEQVFRDEYDRCPDLFLMKRIRDIAVHSTLELVHVSHGTRVTDADVATVEKWSGIHLNVKTLLADKKKMNNRLKEHVRSLGPTVPVVEVMERALADLARIDHLILPDCHPDLLRQCALVVGFRDLIQNEMGRDLTGVVILEYDENTGEHVMNEDGSYTWHGVLEDDGVGMYASRLVAAANPGAPASG